MARSHKPKDVVEALDPDDDRVKTWTREMPSGPVTVGYVPSKDPRVRRRQELDLLSHLEERAPEKDRKKP